VVGKKDIMENEFDPIAEQLQELIQQKSFEALTPAERDFVLEQTSEEDYRVRRAVIENSEELFDEERPLLVPNPAIKARVKEQIKSEEEEERRVPLVVALFSYKIPAYQAGIAAIILLGLLIYRPEIKEAGKTTKGETVYVDRIDTLYVEKEVHRVDTVTEYVTIPSKEQVRKHSRQNNNTPTKGGGDPVLVKQQNNSTPTLFAASNPTVNYSVDQLMEKNTKPSGNSFKDDKDMSDIMVRVY
jgi:hypothetical protein